jgi:hypothetical protein
MAGFDMQTRRWQSQKRNSLLAILSVTVVLSICLAARFVPVCNDAISGKPEYMRWIADRVAHTIASQYGDEAAIIAVRDERTDCRQIADVAVPSTDDLFYVVSYSEREHSVCFLTYARLPEGWDQANSIILDQKMGRNYGQRLERPVRVVPVSQLQVVYPLAYLSLLHWRTRINASSFSRAADAKFERWFNSSTEPAGSVDIEIDFPSLRADVGSRHRIVNRVLAAAIFTSASLLLFAAYKTWTSYVLFRAFLTRYHQGVSFQSYLSQDLTAIVIQAHEAWQREQKHALEQAREAIVARRSKEAIRARLESILSALPNGQERIRGQECLGRDNVEEMRALVQEIQGQVGQRPPEEKLTVLLDSLKQYCTSEELDQFCTQGFQILATAGFKDARSFVVAAHDQLRARQKELEKQNTPETEQASSQSRPGEEPMLT